ncbi:MAG: peptidase S15, partial [Gammaproteobacteria bacterium]
RTRVVKPELHNWRVIRDLESDESTLEVINDNGIQYIKEIDLELGRKAIEWYTYQGDDFNSVRGETLWERSYCRGDWHIKTVTRTVLTSSATDFYLRAELDAYEGDKRVYSDNWDCVIPRDYV